MAGSLGRYVYKDDNATKYLVQIDESNATVTGTGFVAATQQDVDTLPSLPKTLKMRYVNCVEPTTKLKRRIYVGALTGTLWTHATTTVSLMDYESGELVTFKVSSRIGEKQQYIYV